MTPWLALVCRDLSLALRQGMDSLSAVMFFVLAVVLFPFGVGPEPAILARIGAGVIWVAALLAAMLSMERLFQADLDDGSLEQLALGPLPLWAVAVAKIAAHWLTSAVPLIIAAPLLAVLMNLDAAALPALLASLALGTPTLSLIGGVGAALVLGTRRAGVLLALLVLPLFIPVLVFGVAAVDAAMFGEAVQPHLALLLALLLTTGVVAPWAASAALRSALGQ
jgi:heme exporter protein B